MTPIFKEYIDFLNYKTDNALDFLEEGIYWYDNSIIKAFDTEGNLVKVVRLNIGDDLSITPKKYKKKIPELETWNDTCKRYEDKLLDLEEETILTIMQGMDKYKGRKIAVLNSGGKDSTVMNYFVKDCYPNAIQIFNNTTMDCADTYKYIKKLDNLKIITPKEGFYQWRKRLNFIPTGFVRACCKKYKEEITVSQLSKEDEYLFFMGMRNEESLKRANYEDEWKSSHWGNRKWDAILPIRKWSELEIWLCILKYNIPFNPKYRKGYRRVGCNIVCPYYKKSTWVLDEYWYPKAFKRWQDILRDDFKNNNRDLILNCTEDEYLNCYARGRLRKEPTEEVINQFAERNNLDINVAKNYFNHTCDKCNKRIKTKEEIGMNMKFNGREADSIFCKKCLKNIISIDDEAWDKYIELYKQDCCELF